VAPPLKFNERSLPPHPDDYGITRSTQPCAVEDVDKTVRLQWRQDLPAEGIAGSAAMMALIAWLDGVRTTPGLRRYWMSSKSCLVSCQMRTYISTSRESARPSGCRMVARFWRQTIRPWRAA
jgi:hypothetical protein